MQRSAGILLPVSSLPSPYGIGCFSQEAYDFVDWLKEAGQTYWQILPLGVTSYGDSPYQSFSAFAGNPYFISLDALVEEGVLTAAECKKANFGRKADDIDYSRLYAERGRLLRLAYSRSDIGHNEAFTAFCEKNKWWLDDFALFMAVKGRFEGKPWIEWAEDIRLRWQPAMDYYRRELYFEVEYHKYLQFKFDQQWRRLKAYANSKGIKLVGDIPIYVAADSADAWAGRELFEMDSEGHPRRVAGCPPDYFAEAKPAIEAMMAQAGHPVFDADGILQKGVILRHLALPGHVDDSFAVLDQMAAWNDADPGCFIPSVMSQYTPFYKATEHGIGRRITTYEYRRVVNYAMDKGLAQGYMQQKSSAKEEYTPSFDLTGV